MAVYCIVAPESYHKILAYSSLVWTCTHYIIANIRSPVVSMFRRCVNKIALFFFFFFDKLNCVSVSCWSIIVNLSVCLCIRSPIISCAGGIKERLTRPSNWLYSTNFTHKHTQSKWGLAFACFLHVRCETSLSVDSQRHAAVILNHHSVKKTNPGFMDHV